MGIKENKTIPSILLKISSFIILLSAIYTLYNLITMKPIATEEAFKFGKIMDALLDILFLKE